MIRKMPVRVLAVAASLNRGKAIPSSRSDLHPFQGKTDRNHSHPLRKEALDFVQHGEFPDKRIDFDAPNFPLAQDLLTGGASPGSSSLPAPTLELGVLPFAAPVRRKNRRQAPAPARVGLCTSIECSIQHTHFEGVYLYQDYPLLSQGPFGASNLPPSIWTAYHRLQEGQETPEDFALFWGFKKYHTATSLENLLR